MDRRNDSSYVPAGKRTPRTPSQAWGPEHSVSFAHVFGEELRYVAQRRRTSHANPRNHLGANRSTTRGVEPRAGAAAATAGATFPPTVAENLVGLAFSGGGIRAATSCLGMVQALSRMRLLPQVDYLSTVSGGGYIGGCLSWLLSIHEHVGTNPGANDPYTFGPGESTLFDTNGSTFPLAAVYHPPGHRGKEQVEHLRTHGNFVIARTGIFARETLRALGQLIGAAIYNIAFVLAVLFVITSLYLAIAGWLAPGLHDDLERRTPLVNTATGVPTNTPPSMLSCGPNPTPSCRPATFAEQVQDRARRLIDVAQRARDTVLTFAAVAAAGCAMALVLFVASSRLLLSVGIARPATTKAGDAPEDTFERRYVTAFAVTSIASLAITVAAAATLGFSGQTPPERLFLPVVFSGAAWVTAFLIHLLVPWWDAFRQWARPHAEAMWTRNFRSLWGSAQALLGYLALLSVIIVFLPVLVYTVREYRLPAAIGALVSLAAARAFTWRSPAAGAQGRFRLPAGVRRLLLGVAVALFCILTIVAIASYMAPYGFDEGGPDCWLLVAGAGVLLTLVIAGFLVDLNAVSPHEFYRDRLAETYLRTDIAGYNQNFENIRVPFVNGMEMNLSDLHGNGVNGDPVWGNSAPYHLISAAINLAGSRDLSRKDRKSGYFLFSKMFCGSVHTGFMATARYRNGETKLARALTISGAAVSSGVGFHTFFAQAFATVLFNLRLGLWLENPKHPKSTRGREGGVFWPLYLAIEMFANTSERRRLVNVSDGGHTGDNVGIYPLLQRRCKLIIACDAERDRSLSFGSFTEALRHAYIDEGIDIDIDMKMLRPDPTTGLSRSHCAVGRIHYPDRPAQASWLVYMKNSLTGDEPAAVQNYKSSYPDFPHESTADLFFGDAQFEAYRALGVHVVEHTFEEWLARVALEGALR